MNRNMVGHYKLLLHFNFKNEDMCAFASHEANVAWVQKPLRANK